MKHHDLPEPEALARACSSLGVSPPADFHGRLAIYLDLLAECAGRMNLIGPAETGRLWGRHVKESVSYAAFIRPGSEVTDIGSGAGFPGFVLSLLGFSTTLIEPRRKRAAFLETAARECSIDSCTVLCSRVEDAGPFPSETVFTSRAVKGAGTIISLLRDLATGPFTLLTRVENRELVAEEGCVLHRLPSPPLDRDGFLLQYSHSGKTNTDTERCAE
ncbi:MAG TPA: class I SAM-dependent methyltransferase [Candidatus Sabulitectum sp.]|nr:class I SAM-dependent methyltransferase [Candidatus Sabulitectum sp.]HPF33766.1 class I SAM-dependent methyltransferase [Candidatus Sabulitectum sp.]HPJ29519.1 class I SAM-dependent methyltransferase [Candidatus Sabulitectum sp.]HPR23353.1 class I SAM-dependent methyltransferase [Candidatus Sabulitectum sp.]